MPMRDLPSLGGVSWLVERRLSTVMHALNAEGETRIAGGAVRNALLGAPIADIDLATVLLPQQVMKLGRAHGFGVHPTGLEHGTVMLSFDGAAFEVTTLRKDIATDGRHAVVSFTQDWSQDAARRDFTMNALYCDASGKIYDFTDGYRDICKRKVRFVGQAEARIREDALRILRFFRMHASYGRGAAEAAALKACIKRKADLKTLSTERIRQELLKLIVAPGAVKTMKLMADCKLLKILLPHTENWRALSRCPADALLRLLILAKQPLDLKTQLKLSNAEASRIENVVHAPAISPRLTDAEQRRILYQLGAGTWRDVAQIHFAQSRAKLDNADWASLLGLAERWPVPVFPVKGADLVQQGIAAGPALGQVLQALEDWWIASDFQPTREALLQRSHRYQAQERP